MGRPSGGRPGVVPGRRRAQIQPDRRRGRRTASAAACLHHVRDPGTVVGYDVTDDVAIVQLAKASGLPTVTTGESATVSPGDAVTAVGNALGQGGTPAVVTGTVTDLHQTITVSDDVTGGDRQLTD